MHLEVVHHYNEPNLGEDIGITHELILYWLENCPHIWSSMTDYYHKIERIICRRLKIPCEPALLDYTNLKEDIRARFESSHIPNFHFSIFKCIEQGDCIPVDHPFKEQYVFDASNARIVLCFEDTWVRDLQLSQRIRCLANGGMCKAMELPEFRGFIRLESVLENENNVLNINLRGAVRPLLNYLACNERPQWITLGKFLEGWVKSFEG